MRIALLIVSVLLSPLATADIYRWVDPGGNVHFSAKPQPGAEQVEVRPQVVHRDDATRERQARTERFFEARREEQAAARVAASARQGPVSYTHLRAHETPEHLVCRLLLEKKKQ